MSTATDPQEEGQSREDDRSDTSTIEYEQEPFATYQNKVFSVATRSFGRGCSVERMKGGSYNRVLSITVRKPPPKLCLQRLKSYFHGCLRRNKPEQLDEYVFRVPRPHNKNDMSEEVAIHNLVHFRLPIPTTEIITYDLSTENILQSPYMIQRRLTGQNLEDLWPILNINQKRNVAKQVAMLAPTIATISGPFGRWSGKNLSRRLESPIEVCKFQLYDEPRERSYEQKPVEYLLDFCERRHNCMRNQNSEMTDHIWDTFAAIFRCLDTRGFLEGPCVLAHGDLEAYNILAAVKNNSEVEITAIIDWDMAAFVPEVVAYRPPFWLWTPENLAEYRNYPPPSEECKALRSPETYVLKKTFVNSASEKQIRLAFAPEAVLARRMINMMQDDVRGPWDYVEIVRIVRDWMELHPEDGVQPLSYWEDSDDEDDSFVDDSDDGEGNSHDGDHHESE